MQARSSSGRRALNKKAQALVVEYLGYALTIARRFVAKRSAVKHFAEELEDAAMDGLIQAASSFRKSKAKNIEFKYFAAIRIRGAIKDYLRKQDYISRDDRKKQKQGLEVPEYKKFIVLHNVATDCSDKRSFDQSQYAYRNQLDALFEKILTPIERHVVYGLEQGYTLEELAVALRLSISRVYQLRRGVKQRLREYFLEEGFDIESELSL